jgi:hypothetical protein
MIPEAGQVIDVVRVRQMGTVDNSINAFATSDMAKMSNGHRQIHTEGWKRQTPV